MKNRQKEFTYIRKLIGDIDLDLRGLNILTEIGNSYYFYLPFIAAMAGAKKVFAWTSNNNYFEVEKVIAEATLLIEEFGFEDVIVFAINDRPIAHIANADIITNSGFVRPLNKQLLSQTKKEVVIPLMFEAWEIRENDIDILYCKENKIKVAGTNENHSTINVFEYVGPLAIKIAMEAGYEVFNNTIIIWSNDAFGEVTKKFFERMLAKEVILTTDKKIVLESLYKTDFIYFCSNHEQRIIISNQVENALFSIDEIKARNPNIGIIHLYGSFNLNELQNEGLYVYPINDGRAEYMSKTLTHIGMQPTINLLAAGLKVGEEMNKNCITSLSQIITQ